MPFRLCATATPGTATFLPLCTRCSSPMRLVSIEPDPRFSIIERRHFECSCGQEFNETLPCYWLGILED